MTENKENATADAVHKLQAIRQDLNGRALERSEAIDGMLLAVLTQEACWILGPPGTSKSSLVRSLAACFGGSYFEALLTRFSTIESIGGPLSLKALEEDRYERKMNGFLPTAHFAFLDEVARGSSAILNCILSLLQEKTWSVDGTVIKCPLQSLFGAMNSLPEGQELEALCDRFLIKLDVGYLIRPGSFRALLDLQETPSIQHMTLDELGQAQSLVAGVKLTDDTVIALIDIKDGLARQGIIASDRRWRKATKIVKASAFLSGSVETSPEDLAVLVNCLWREPKEIPKIRSIVGPLADPAGTQAQEILDAAREEYAKASELRTAASRPEFISKAALVVDAFNKQRGKLDDLSKGAGRRAKSVVADAKVEIEAMHRELARQLSAGLGLGITGGRAA
jgi:MoxR-like ATPase